jgi:hypothetical protein
MLDAGIFKERSRPKDPPPRVCTDWIWFVRDSDRESACVFLENSVSIQRGGALAFGPQI